MDEMGIYHVLNRGVDGRKIFNEEKDYVRFIHDLYEFNDRNPAINMWYSFNKYSDVRHHYMEKRRERDMLVRVLAFALMPNHYHLLLQPIADNGIPLFIKKLNGGYAKYYNEKYKRHGTLFQGRYKSIHVEHDAHFIHLPYYIHLNPLDLVYPTWRQRTLSNPEQALQALLKYRWSSHMDYMGVRNFPSVTDRTLLLDYFGGEKEYGRAFSEWVKEMQPQTAWESVYGLLLEEQNSDVGRHYI